jgi:sugar lactone lactonase YvrE
MSSTGVVLPFLLLSFAAQAQQYVISTYAGGAPPPGMVSTPISVGTVATDASGNLYFSYFTTTCMCIFKLNPDGILTHVAGSAQRGFSGDGGPATSAQLGSPSGLAVDTAGNLFIADPGVFHAGTHGVDRIRKVSPDGIITTVAGGGVLFGSSADGGPATSAELSFPIGVAVDDAGNLFFSESVDADQEGSNRVRKVSADGLISTVAGNGMFGFSGDGGPATSAQLAGPGSLALDSTGNLFFVDLYNQRIRKVSPDGTIATAVDTSMPMSTFCDCSVSAVTMDKAGNLFYTVSSDSVFKKSPDGIITTLVGTDAGLQVWWLAVDGAGNLFLPYGSSFRKVSPDGLITTLLGDGACCYSGDGGPATSAQLNHTNSVAADGAGNLFIADTDNHRIRRVSPDGIIATVAGNGEWSAVCNLSSDSEPATSAHLCRPSQVAADGTGNLFMVDGNRIRKVSPDGTITPVAGTGVVGVDGDGGLATGAQLAYPNSVAADGAGNLYFAEWARVRKISPDGIITTVAGDGTRLSNNGGCLPIGSPGCGPPPPTRDGGPATLAQLWGPASVTVDGAGNLYFVDGVRIRKVSPDGIITTVAGNGNATGYHGFTGDGGPATNAPLWNPNGVTVDSAGNLFISEPVRIRKVTRDGIINTIAGSSDPGYSGDGGLAAKAQLWNPTGLTVDAAGNVYFADSFNNVVRILGPVR